MKTSFLMYLGLICSFGIAAQDCNSPSPLCYIQFDNIVADSTGGGSLTADYGTCGQSIMNGSLYEITSVAAGDFAVVLQSVNCGDANPSLEESLVMTTFTATDPCSPSPGTISCQTTTGSLTQNLTADSAGQVFYVAIYGTEDILGVQAECDYEIQIDGDAVEFALTVPTTPYSTLQGQPVEIEGVDGVEMYEWSGPGDISDPEAANPTVTPYNIGTQTFTVSGTQGECEVEGQVIIDVLPFIQPGTLITPNDDGIYDEWYISSLDESNEKVDIKVFSRWGQRVYHSIGYDLNNLWDGTFNGSRLPAGAYYYIIELNLDGFESEPFTGAVSILY